MNSKKALKYIKEDNFPMMIATYPPIRSTLEGYTKDELFSIIEKELKALEIIDKKGLSTNELWFIKNGKSFENYTETMKELYWGDETIEKELKTEDEFDLLKEVLQ